VITAARLRVTTYPYPSFSVRSIPPVELQIVPTLAIKSRGFSSTVASSALVSLLLSYVPRVRTCQRIVDTTHRDEMRSTKRTLATKSFGLSLPNDGVSKSLVAIFSEVGDGLWMIDPAVHIGPFVLSPDLWERACS